MFFFGNKIVEDRFKQVTWCIVVPTSGVVHLQSLTWNLKIMVCNSFPGDDFRFHVKLQGCVRGHVVASLGEALSIMACAPLRYMP